MTTQQWAEVPDNPAQRDTNRHANTAQKNHLSKPCPTQAIVAACQYPDGSMQKLDGHTRSLLWQIGKLAPPPYVLVDIYPVKSQEDATRLYSHFDNASATETSKDKRHGAFRLHGITPKSQLLKEGGINTALNDLMPDESIYEQVKNAAPELKLLDELMLTQNRFPSALITAAIMTLRKDGQAAQAFWVKVHNNDGTRTAGRSDGVDALCRLLSETLGNQRIRQAKSRADITAKAISAYLSYKIGYTYSTGIKASSLAELKQQWSKRSKK